MADRFTPGRLCCRPLAGFAVLDDLGPQLLAPPCSSYRLANGLIHWPLRQRSTPACPLLGQGGLRAGDALSSIATDRHECAVRRAMAGRRASWIDSGPDR